MFWSLPNIVRKTFIYGFFNLVSASVPFFLLPVLTRYISVEGYGILALIAISVQFLGVVFRLEVQSALKREYIKKKEDFSEYVGTSLIIPILIFVITLIIFAASYSFMESVVDIPVLWILGILIMSFGAALSTYLTALYHIKDQAVAAGLWAVLASVCIFLGTFILVVFFDFDWQGRVWPMVATAIIIQIPLSFYFIYRIVPYRLSFNFEKTMELLRFSVPLIPMTIAIYTLQVADRLFIIEMVGLEAAGLYAVSSQLAAIMMLAYSSFLPTWEVLVMQKLKEHTREGYTYIMFFFALFVAGMIALALFVIFVFPHIMPWVLGKDFMGSMEFLSWLVVAISLRGIFFSLMPFICYIRKTMLIMYTNIFLVILNLFLNYALISINGAIGAAQATCIVYGVGLCIFLSITKKYYSPS